MKRTLVLLIALLLCMVSAQAEISAAAQLNAPGITVGVDQGSAAELIVREQLPQATMAYFTDKFMGYTAVAQGKIDAFAYDRAQMELAINEGQSGVRLLDETLGEPIKIAVGLSPVSGIADLESKVNQFIADLRADGTLADMYERWVMKGEEEMPKITLPGHPSLHLTVGTTGVVPPYSYYQDGKLNGYDIELAYRFAAWLSADVEFKVYDYGAIIPAALTGDVDCVMANLNLTPERQEALTFSDVLYEDAIGIMVQDEAAAEAPASTEPAPAWAAYNGKRLGVLVGPLMEDIARTNFPDSEYMLFNSYPDCITALVSGRIDAYLGDEPGLKSVHAEQPQIDYIHERITNQDYSFAFRKNDPESAKLCEELNAFLAKSHADGTMQELDDIWFGVDESRKVVDMSDLTGENGTIRVVTTSTDMPWSYIKDG
ncbi:MAG: transporter substrate-binding domain-containing protein, partial [Clostridia bacterium]|nr:transporter substrate-binding domain-containing protein [Clostridia bacterium]